VTDAFALPWAPRGLDLPAAFEPPATSLRPTGADDPRLARLLGAHVSPDRWPAVAILGFPSDDGVARNGGRVGASAGPDVIREALYRMTPDRDARFCPLLARTTDFGNLAWPGTLEDAQEALGRVVAACLARETIPVILGGGHETAFGHFLGYARSARPVHILNWDAHPDVRPLIDGRGHSGSPFRQALDHPSRVCRSYRVAGLQPHATASAHLEYLSTVEMTGMPGESDVLSGPRFWWRHELSREVVEPITEAVGGPLMVSFDIDAVDQAFAPGVSAPATNGLTPDLWLHAAYAAGASPQVSSCDLVELNPRLDRDGQTARLAALTIWTFLKGIASRKTPSAT